MNTDALTAEAEAGFPLDELTPRFAVRGTPVSRLAQLILDALDGDDLIMARIAAQRLLELGGKT